MQGNDIGVFESISQATMFEGVLASPPVKASRRFKFLLSQGIQNWETALATWTVNDMPVKSLADQTNRLGIGTDVFTFLSPDAVDPISKWLIQKGISVPVYWFPDVEALADNLKFNRGIKTIYTASQEDAQLLGMRATVVLPTKAWPS